MFKHKWLFICVSLAAIGLLAGSWKFVLAQADKPIERSNHHCPFCNERIIAYQAYYEGTHLRVHLNYSPILDGHSMIVPKRHVERIEELSAEEFAEIQDVIKRVQRAFQRLYGASDVLLCCQNGEQAGQTVLHAHIHIIPRVQKNVYTKLKLWYAMLVRPLNIFGPMNNDELGALSARFQEVMQE